MYHLPQGNIILTDNKYEVLTLLRSHRDDEKGFAIMARHPYPMHAVRLRTSVHADDLLAAFTGAPEGGTIKSELVGLGRHTTPTSCMLRVCAPLSLRMTKDIFFSILRGPPSRVIGWA